ncbi:hypothetical protein B0H14DRAFT_2961681 [Mycena olivaceomarginata]|nr:hypothetical protein B0H14DRAFT_2961681 [Mycena olivaceomarginata]
MTTSTSRFVFSEWPPTLSEAHFFTSLPSNLNRSSQNSAIHAPLSVFPSPFPLRLFLLARRLQSTYNILYARIATDVEFLDQVMGAVEGVGKVDDFVGQLWTGWKTLRDEGLVQPLQLGLFRSDYLLHAGLDGEPLSLKQVEIQYHFLRTAALHRYLYATTSYYNTISPPTIPTAGLVEGLAAAHAAYNIKEAKILFVVQAGERNVFDQRLLEYELLENASVDPTTYALFISGDTEISTYSTRFLLERSKAIKCPSIALQLAGGKKVQQVSAAQLDELRESWMGMWGLDEESAPQREGGGNNVYKEAIPARGSRWRTGNYLVRAGSEGAQSAVKLGIFGWALFEGGWWLVRTKGKDSNEGGVATGFRTSMYSNVYACMIFGPKPEA